SQRRSADELGERTIQRCGLGMGARAVARADSNRWRRYLRRLFCAEVRALDTRVRLELGPSKNRAARCGSTSENQFRQPGTLVAGVSSLKRTPRRWQSAACR